MSEILSSGADAPMAPHQAIAKFQRDAIPDWVQTIEAPPAAEDRASGISWMLLDEQFDLSVYPPKRFVHIVKRANNATGADELSEVQITFNPSFETLTLHHVTVRRGDHSFDALQDGDIDVLRVERDMYARVYRGDYTAIIQVRGLEAEDVIACSYTIEGANPSLGRGRVNFQVSHTFDVPLGRRFFRVRNADGSGVNVINVDDAVKLKTERIDGVEESRIDLRDLPAHGFEYWVPGEFDQQASLTATTSFGAWSTVARWGADLYQVKPDDPVIERLAQQCLAENPKAPELAAIAHVQERIRYVSTNFGEGGYRPRSPEVTLHRRYGDCKDKALLLTCLLRRLGHEADIALVDATTRNAPLRAVPSPGAFDHVIVRAEIRGETHWIDATVTGQRGPLDVRDSPHTMTALLARNDVKELVQLPGPRAFLSHQSHEEIDMSAGLGEPVVVSSESTSRGDQAESVRRFVLSNGRDGYQGLLENFESQEHGDVVYDEFEMEDHEQVNEIHLKSRVILDDPWFRSPDRSMTFRRSVCHSTELVPSIAVNRRRLPLLVRSHPMHHLHRVVIKLPPRAKLKDEQDMEYHTRNAGFEFSFRQIILHESLDIKAEVKTMADYVPGEESLGVLREQTILQNLHFLAFTFAPKRGWLW